MGLRTKPVAATALAIICGGVFAGRAARAQLPAAPLNKAVDAASVIIVGRMDQYIAEPEALDYYVENRLSSFHGIAGGNLEAQYLRALQPRGTYVFHVESTIKGDPPEPLIVRLPRATELGYVPGLFATHGHIPLKSNCLLILKGDPKSGFAAVAEAPIPLAAAAKGPEKPPANADAGEQLSAVVHLLADSLSDKRTGAGAAYILSGAKSDEALKILGAHADDPDDAIRAAALAGMAENQDVSAIPRIAAWKYSDPHAGGNPVLLALEKYKAANAIPALNKLVIDPGSQYTRLNAIMALRQLPPDKRSVPYLIKALRDKESIDVQDQAWRCISRLNPDMGPPPHGMNQPIPEDQIKRVEAWWASVSDNPI